MLLYETANYNWFSLVGTLFLLFRIWLAEFKLKDELQFRRHYLSRVVNIHLAVAWMFNFENYIFNVIVITTWPVMFVTTMWDMKFFQLFKKRDYWQKNRGWLVVERLTLHPPILIAGFYFIFAGLTNFINMDYGWYPFIQGIIIVYGPFFLFDKRWSERYNWPQAPIMISVMLISTVIMFSIIYYIS